MVSSIILGAFMFSCAPSSYSSNDSSCDTISEEALEALAEAFDVKDSLSEEEIDSILGKSDLDITTSTESI